MIRISVDLPEPLRPTRAMRSPSCTARDKPSNRGSPPKVSEMSESCRRGARAMGADLWRGARGVKARGAGLARGVGAPTSRANLERERRMEKIKKSDEEWRKELSPEAYRVTRQHGTERPFTG